MLQNNQLEFDNKIEKKKADIQRNQMRLQTLRKVRPQFQDEFEKLEVELKVLYEDYLQKFRYLAYLEHLYEEAAKGEQERFERRYFENVKILEYS